MTFIAPLQQASVLSRLDSIDRRNAVTVQAQEEGEAQSGEKDPQLWAMMSLEAIKSKVEALIIQINVTIGGYVSCYMCYLPIYLPTYLSIFLC